MKLKSVLFFMCFSLMANVFASNIHSHAGTNTADPKVAANNSNSTSSCMIKLVNDLDYPVNIDGTFSDFSGLAPFTLAPYGYYGAVQYIDLYYNWSCHSEMYRVGMDYVNLYHVPANRVLLMSDYLYAKKAARKTK